MRFKNEIKINRPLAEVVSIFNDIDQIQHWQSDFDSLELVSGEVRTEDAQIKMFYKMGGREIEFIETTKSIDLPELIDLIYESAGLWNRVKNKFESIDKENTLWIADNEFRGTRMAINLLLFLSPKTYRNQSSSRMTAFKEYIENKPTK